MTHNRFCLQAATLGLFALVLLPAAPAAALTKVACVGDRLTNSAHRGDKDEYPYLLGLRLGAEYEVKNFGAPKAVVFQAPATSYWKTKEMTASLEDQPDVVVLMWGNNDVAAAWSTKATFVDDYEALVKKYLALPKPPKVFVALTMPRGGKPGGPTETEVIPFTKRVAADLGLPIIDAYTPFLGHEDEYLDPDHPNPTGIKHLADVIYAGLTGRPAPDGGALDVVPRDTAAPAVRDAAVERPVPPPPTRDAGAATGTGGEKPDASPPLSAPAPPPGSAAPPPVSAPPPSAPAEPTVGSPPSSPATTRSSGCVMAPTGARGGSGAAPLGLAIAVWVARRRRARAPRRQP